MNAIRIETIVDEATAQAIPALRLLLGERVELIALHSGPAEPQHQQRISLDVFLTRRLVPPASVGPLSLDDMERAVEKGAKGGID